MVIFHIVLVYQRVINDGCHHYCHENSDAVDDDHCNRNTLKINN